jgi:hypothetical protein
MKYVKRIVLTFSAILLFLGAFSVSASAQQRVVVVRRPVVVYRPYYDPFWSSRYYGSFYDPFYDPYMYDPFLRVQRDRYYKKKDVSDARRKLAQDREKYMRDRVISAEEQEKLDKRVKKLNEAIAKLNKFNNEHPE